MPAKIPLGGVDVLPLHCCQKTESETSDNLPNWKCMYSQKFKHLNTKYYCKCKFHRCSKTYKGKSKSYTYCGLIHKFEQCPAKKAKCKSVKIVVTMLEFKEINIKQENKIMMGYTFSLLYLQEM